MKQPDEILNNAIHALRNDEPGSAQINASATRVAEGLGISGFSASAAPAVHAIGNCTDVEQLLKMAGLTECVQLDPTIVEWCDGGPAVWP